MEKTNYPPNELYKSRLRSFTKYYPPQYGILARAHGAEINNGICLACKRNE